ncbi:MULTISPECIES: sensor histidine kinase [Stutzerimonas stutzeri subgroup]|uniref:sensor histidine kinase n=1 Tax=Stutzerimonas stutzeri subgroup TaxID=578833 RepID=UPI0005A26C28|nr:MULTISPECIES: ATP-binding protein [Stutzerimonas stutzeri subgroup]MBU2332839.1 PAS domain-containing protein [Gammaproteobacteria bacterium]MCQ2038291.1 ATP-binding protein [Stutzerimonas kunmingensis]OHC13562.1 MAG: histidine kinase [Pseudomonadales bacterium GWC2_63_15]
MPTSKPIGLRQWIWRAFVRSALIPLVLVETALIAIYLLTNNAIRDAQVEHLRETALNDLQAAVSLESRLISEQLSQVSSLTQLYRNLTAQALQGVAPGQVPELALSDEGVRYSPSDDGGAAVFYSNATAPERHDLQKIARLRQLEPLMKEIEARNPLVASLYFNSWDSFNHIYPWFFTLDQYPADMDIPKYNFYYLADAKHNPSRGVVWTDVYLDPAGHGWMMSATAPVYHGDFLEGVVGIDITVSGILEQIGQVQVPWGGYAMLVSDDLSIMALPEPGEADFGLAELTEHSYLDAIRREVFKPEDFQLDRRPETAELAAAISGASSGVQQVMLGGRPQLVAWTTVAQTGWHLLAVVDEAAVFRQTNALASRYQQIGYLLIAGLVLFYIGFFALMWLRARQLSGALLTPIAGISRMLGEIGVGRWQPQPAQSQIRELDEMCRHTQDIGSRLAYSESERWEAQRRLELVLESATESLWEYDMPNHRLRIRGGMGTRFGLPSGQLSDSEFRRRIHPDDLPQALAQIERVSRGLQQRYEAEYRFADTQGHYHWLLSRGRVLEHDPDTGVAKILAGTHVDIDALKRVEEELRAATLQAQAASEAKGRLLSGISHELRTPLNAILGFAQLMRMDCDDESQSEAAEYLDEILLASRHLNQLLGEILEWSSLQNEPAQLELQAVDVCKLMRECAELVSLEVQQRGLHLQLQLPDEPLQVLAEPRRLRQVLLNLLSNAMKYNVPDGHISLRTETSPGHVRLLVEDTGLGIEPAQQAQVFEPFQRLGRENSMIQGTGIGLSLCLEFARLMNGQLGLHSEPGVGSRFWIELPRLAPAALQ